MAKHLRFSRKKKLIVLCSIIIANFIIGLFGLKYGYHRYDGALQEFPIWHKLRELLLLFLLVIPILSVFIATIITLIKKRSLDKQLIISLSLTIIIILNIVVFIFFMSLLPSELSKVTV